MLELKLREEFRGKQLKGTTVDFTNQSKTGALEVPAGEFLKITYPSFDLLKTIEATGPGQSRPVVLLGDRGQGKSHLLAALYHLFTSPSRRQAVARRLGRSPGQPVDRRPQTSHRLLRHCREPAPSTVQVSMGRAVQAPSQGRIPAWASGKAWDQRRPMCPVTI